MNLPHFPVLFKIAVSGGNPTSTGSTPLSIVDSNNSNDIETGEAADQAIIWAKSIGTGQDLAGLGRALAIDKNGFLWVGMFYSGRYWKVNPNNGLTIGTPIDTQTPFYHQPYGCQVDVNGHLWSVDEANTLAEIDTSTGKLVGIYQHPDSNYSIAVFNDCTSSPPKVKVYLSNRSGHTYIVYDPDAPPTARFSNSPGSIHQFPSYAVAVDKAGNIISGSFTGEVMKTTPSGTIIWSNSSVVMLDLHGLIIDENDDVWAIDRYGGRVVRYDGGSGQTGPSDIVKVGLEPYTYGNTPPPACNTPSTPPACAKVTDKDIHCEPNGGYSYTFSVTNNSGKDASQILLTPTQGSSFTLSQQLFNLSPVLHNGQSTTLTVKIKNVKPGTKVCFFLSFTGKDHPCCIVKVCPTLPTCGATQSPSPQKTDGRKR
ncbi:MAG: hypothetical protein H0X40_07590 [Chthoniobacterales bacterium]|nr:hypothetical protein [Chthoniobacterales bacterium]